MIEKKRNKILTLFLIIIFISIFFSILFNIYILKFSRENTLLIFNIILSMLKMLSIIMIFSWKKVGVYLIFGSTFFNTIINLTVSKNIMNIVITLATFLCFSLIFYILVKEDFKYMN